MSSSNIKIYVYRYECLENDKRTFETLGNTCLDNASVIDMREYLIESLDRWKDLPYQAERYKQTLKFINSGYKKYTWKLVDVHEEWRQERLEKHKKRLEKNNEFSKQK